MMEHAHKRLAEMLESYQTEHGRKPQVIALGRTHLEDLQESFEVRPDGLYFEGVAVMQHDDPMGVLMAHDNRRTVNGG